MSNYIVFEGDTPSFLLFTASLKLLTQKNEAFQFRIVSQSNFSIDDFNWMDGFISIRKATPFEYHLAKLCHKHNKKVVYVIDDDLLALNSDYGKDHEGVWPKRNKALLTFLKNVDCLISGNENIINKYTKLGNIPSFGYHGFIAEQKPIMPIQHSNAVFKIVMYVNDGTTSQFDKIIMPCLSKLNEQLPNKLAFYLIGFKPNINETDISHIEINYVEHMQYANFQQYMIENNFDLGLAPLEDDQFVICKSYNKFFEFTKAGIPGIYSNCYIYQQIINDKQNGLIVNNNVDEWVNAISHCLEHPQERFNYALNAYNDFITKFDKDVVLGKLLQDCPFLIESPHNSTASNIVSLKLALYKFEDYIFKIRGRFYLGFQYLKQGKIKELLRRFLSLYKK